MFICSATPCEYPLDLPPALDLTLLHSTTLPFRHTSNPLNLPEVRTDPQHQVPTLQQSPKLWQRKTESSDPSSCCRLDYLLTAFARHLFLRLLPRHRSPNCPNRPLEHRFILACCKSWHDPEHSSTPNSLTWLFHSPLGSPAHPSPPASHPIHSVKLEPSSSPSPSLQPVGSSRRAGTMGSDGNRRGPWSQSEDRRLLHFINEEGPQNWVAIAQEVGGRSAKQCRERYHQNLKPGLNHSPISEEEAKYILDQVAARGPRWAEISRELKNNRSDNAVKNWWNGYFNRTKRLQAREKATAEGRASASSSRPTTSDTQHPFLPPGLATRYGPAPLPSPTETGFSPRSREAHSSWSRDPLPPSPSSVASDQSASSRTRYESMTHLPPQRSSHYASAKETHPRLTSPSRRGHAESSRQNRPPTIREQYGTPAERMAVSNWAWAEYEYGLPRGYWDRPTSPEASRSADFSSYAAHEVPRSELGRPDERQYYHSHRLPLPEPHRQPDRAGARDYGQQHGTDHRARGHTETPAPRARDDRMSVSALMD